MTMHTTRLLARDLVAEDTLAFHFERPPGFEFKPGQAMDVVLGADQTSTQPEVRHTFSIVSAPFQNELMVATRMRDSAFKRALGALPMGSALTLDGPFGSLGLHKAAARAAVFIAGGIGITPFMSMLRQAAHLQTPQDLLLLYSNHRPEDAAFLGELQQLATANPRFHMHATMTQMGRSTQPWAGHTGPIDSGFVQRATQGLAAPICYIAGPPAMVEAMRQVLAGAGVDEDDVRSEEFFGY